LRYYLEQKFFKAYQGYHVQEMLVEVFGEENCARSESAGFYCINDYRKYYKSHPAPLAKHYPYLLDATEADTRVKENCLIFKTFPWTPPRFFFSEIQRRILCEDRMERINVQITQKLKRSDAVIRGQWSAMYQIVREEAPGILPPSGEDRRGMACKDRLMAYIEDYPEVLRP